MKGQIDFWDLEKLTEVGSAKSDCAIGIEWAADGAHLMTSVIYERVKVDNQINVFNGCGKSLIPKGHQF